LKNIDYRYIIVFLILFVTIPISIRLLYQDPGGDEALITVNKKKISKSDIEKTMSIDSCENNYPNLINSIVVKELLIQEAVRIGINKEKTFQESIRNYYEQSLIKILMDRQYAELSSEVDPQLIEKYNFLSDKLIKLTLITYNSYEDYNQNKIHSKKKISLPFNSLSTFLRYQILTLKEGEMTKPVFSDTSTEVYNSIYTVFRLDKIEKITTNAHQPVDTAVVSELISEQKKEALIYQWIENLKSKANVSLSPDLKTIQP